MLAFAKSRLAWFLGLRFLGNVSNFLLMAVMARVIEVDELAVFLAAYAFAAIVEPMITASMRPIVARYMLAEDDPRRQVGVLRTAYLVLQGLAVVIIGSLMVVQWYSSGQSMIAVCILLYAMCAPLSLLSLSLSIQDKYLFTAPIAFVIKVVGTTLRILTLLLTGNLVIVSLLLSFEPVAHGIVFAIVTRKSLFSGPLFVPSVARRILRQFPVLSAESALGVSFWRSPVLLAEWFLRPIDVVHMALSMQLVMGLCIVPYALLQSLFGPMARAVSDNAAFRRLCSLGSSMTVLWGVAGFVGVALFGDFVLVFVFGAKAEGAIDYAVWLSIFPIFAGVQRLMHDVSNLVGRPIETVYSWTIALISQGLLAMVLSFHPSAQLLAVWTVFSFFISAAITPFFWRVQRRYVRDVLLGFSQVRQPVKLLQELNGVMIKHPAA